MANRFSFRVWDKKQQKCIEDFFICGEDVWCGNFITGDVSKITEEVILMQSTGLVDKNGKEIFENDIVNRLFDEKLYSTIVFFNGKFGYFCNSRFYKEDTELDFIPITPDRAKVMTIKGNIYENSDLIKE